MPQLRALTIDITKMPSFRLAEAEGLDYLGDNTAIQMLKEAVIGDFALSNF